VHYVSFRAVDGHFRYDSFQIGVYAGCEAFDDGLIDKRVVVAHLIDDFLQLGLWHYFFGKGSFYELQDLLIILDSFNANFGV
jgi:hypothetical protein